MFHVTPLPHQSGLRPASFPGGEAFVPCFGQQFYQNVPETLQKDLPRRGRGTARRRWMRGGTALYVVGTMGAEVKRSPHMSFRANAVSRGIHASSRFYLVVVHFPTWWIPPLRWRCGRNDTMGGVSGFVGNGSVLSGAERHKGRSLRFR